METQIYVGLSGQLAIQQRLEVLANNVANANTAGFKAESILFQSYLEPAEERRTVAYVVDKMTHTDFSAGGYEKTGNSLDVAVSGDGWFQVNTPQGQRYTRDGRLALSADGTIVTLAGAPVVDEGGAPIQIPSDAGRLEILKDGTVTDGARTFGRLGVVRIEDKATMLHEADGLYTAKDPAVAAQDFVVHQGMIETSNVNPVLQMTQLIDLSHAYEQAKAVVEGGDETTRSAIRSLGQVS